MTVENMTLEHLNRIGATLNLRMDNFGRWLDRIERRLEMTDPTT